MILILGMIQNILWRAENPEFVEFILELPNAEQYVSGDSQGVIPLHFLDRDKVISLSLLKHTPPAQLRKSVRSCLCFIFLL